MKYNYLKSAVFAVILTGLFSAKTSAQVDKCGNHMHHVETQYPGTQQKADAFVEDFKNWIQTADLSSFETSESGKRIIPVVFHMHHRGVATGSSPLSKTRANILAHIAILNRNINGLHPSLPTNLTAFDTLIADAQIEFRLASLDPQGNPTDGVEYLFTGKTIDVRDDMNFKQLSVWDRRKYYNIWVVESIEGSGSGTTLGYAQFPFQNGNTPNIGATDGITILAQEVKTGSAGTTTHETGHWLGLRHIWGDQECGDDGIEDTPVHFGPNFSSSSCFPIPKEATCYNLTGLTGSDSVDFATKRYTIGEMWMNFMDYTDDNCLWMFTKGQKAMMDFVFSNYSFRGSLITAANNIATGTDDDAFANPVPAAPIADFYANRLQSDRLLSIRMACENAPINFKGGEYNAIATSYSWDLPGASPSSGSTKDLSASYATAGEYSGSFTATNGVGSSTKTRSNYIRIFPAAAEVNSTWGYMDYFEYNSDFEQGKWLLVNEDAVQNPSNKWEHFTGAGYNSSKSLRMINAGNVRSEKDAIITPSFNLSSIPGSNLTVSFRFASAKKTEQFSQEDKIEVFYSTDCGETWTATLTNTITADQLATAGLQSNAFVPQKASDWGLKQININSIRSQTNVRFMILFTSGGSYGNDVFIDDFNIIDASQIGVVEAPSTSFNIFPNPVTEESTIAFEVNETKDLNISILDITGRVLHQVFAGNVEPGSHQISINSNLFQSAGVYFVRMTANNEISTKKIVVTK